MIGEQGWLPRNSAVTLDVRRVFGAPDQRLVEVITWRGFTPIGSDPLVVGAEEIGFIRVRAQYKGAPFAYEAVKGLHTHPPRTCPDCGGTYYQGTVHRCPESE